MQFCESNYYYKEGVAMNELFLAPGEVAKNFVEVGHKKASMPVFQMFLLGILAGAFIAFAAAGSNTAIHTIQSVGVGKTVAGALFATGLMMVIIAGGELFTGNTLIVVSCAEGKTKWSQLLKNWTVVYLANFVGAFLIVLLIQQSGQLGFSGGMLGGFTIKVAAYKTNLTFMNALTLGILCNWLVCLAVWMASAAEDITGKVFAIFFPIWLFITSGYEHSIANMYYIPSGILAKSNPQFVEQALKLGVSPEKLDALNWGSFITKNLIPVTLGNIIGGAVCVGLVYWLSYVRKKENVLGNTKWSGEAGKLLRNSAK